MASAPVTDIFSLAQSENVKSDIRHISWIPEASFSRDSRLPTSTSDASPGRVQLPYIIWATINDPQTADIDKLAPFGVAVANFAKENEPDTLFYSDAKPQDLTADDQAADAKGGFIAALEVYASKQACIAHLGDDSVKKLAAESGRLNSTLKAVLMNMVDGWLIR